MDFNVEEPFIRERFRMTKPGEGLSYRQKGRELYSSYDVIAATAMTSVRFRLPFLIPVHLCVPSGPLGVGGRFAFQPLISLIDWEAGNSAITESPGLLIKFRYSMTSILAPKFYNSDTEMFSSLGPVQTCPFSSLF